MKTATILLLLLLISPAFAQDRRVTASGMDSGPSRRPQVLGSPAMIPVTVRKQDGADLFPVEIANVDKIGARDPRKARNVHAAREQTPIHIGKGVGPASYFGPSAIRHLRVHGAEDFADHFMGV